MAIAGYHLEAGSIEFAGWSRRMINDLGDWVIPHLPELYHRVLENVYWRSKRPGSAPDKAESLKDVVAKALYESSQPQEPQRNQSANEQALRASRPRLVKARDISGDRSETPGSGTGISNKNIITRGFDKPGGPLTLDTSGADRGQHSRRLDESGPEIELGSDDDETGATTSTYSMRPTHLSEAELNQLMSRPDMKATDTKGAGAARPHRHHLFIQTRREWFRKRGILIDRYTIEMSQGEHSAHHTIGWTKRTEDFIGLEKALGRNFSPIDILRFGVKLRREFRLKGRRIVPYED
jgi:hypothetical protein